MHRFLTNKINSFEKTFVSETGPISVNVSTMMKSHIPKQKPNIIKQRKYKHFDKNKFEKENLKKLSKFNNETF